MENNRCHLAESWASRPPLLPHGMPPTFAFGNKDSWGQKTDSKYLLANSYLQAGLLNLYPPPLKTRASVSEKFNEGIFFGGWGLTFILEKSIDIDLTLLWWKHYKLEYNFPTRLNVPGTFFHIFETNNSILLDWVYYDYSSSSCHILEGCKCTACLHLIETFTVLSNTVGKKLRPPDWPSIDMPLQIKKALRWLKTLCYRGLM